MVYVDFGLDNQITDDQQDKRRQKLEEEERAARKSALTNLMITTPQTEEKDLGLIKWANRNTGLLLVLAVCSSWITLIAVVMFRAPSYPFAAPPMYAGYSQQGYYY